MGDCGFMAATLYAKSIFGEDALANLSIEKPVDSPNAPVTGHIRIRAKSQVTYFRSMNYNRNRKIGFVYITPLIITYFFVTGYGFELGRQNHSVTKEDYHRFLYSSYKCRC